MLTRSHQTFEIVNGCNVWTLYFDEHIVTFALRAEPYPAFLSIVNQDGSIELHIGLHDEDDTLTLVARNLLDSGRCEFMYRVLEGRYIEFRAVTPLID